MFGVQTQETTAVLEAAAGVTAAPLPTCNLSQILSAQHQLNAAALFSSNPPQYLINAQQLQVAGVAAAAAAAAIEGSPARRRRPLNLMSFEGIELVHHNSNRELHQAEKIVENAEQLQKSAFRFDTITPKRTSSPRTTTDDDEATDEQGINGKIGLTYLVTYKF